MGDVSDQYLIGGILPQCFKYERGLYDLLLFAFMDIVNLVYVYIKILRFVLVLLLYFFASKGTKSTFKKMNYFV